MATIPVPKTWATSDTLDAPTLNLELRDALRFLLDQPHALAYRNAGMSVTSGTGTLIPLDSWVDDNDNMHSPTTNPSRITFTTSGIYIIVASISYQDGTNKTGKRVVRVSRNAAGVYGGGTILADHGINAVVGPSTSTTDLVAIIERFSAAEHIEMFAYQDSGVSFFLQAGRSQTYMQAYRLGAV